MGVERRETVIAGKVDGFGALWLRMMNNQFLAVDLKL
jgi:hypothetical protein